MLRYASMVSAGCIELVPLHGSNKIPLQATWWRWEDALHWFTRHTCMEFYLEGLRDQSFSERCRLHDKLYQEWSNSSPLVIWQSAWRLLPPKRGLIPILMKWIRGSLILSYLELGASLWSCLLRSLWGAYRHQLGVVRLHHGGLQVPLANCFVLLSAVALMLCFLLAVWQLLSRISAVMDCRWRLAAAKIEVDWRCRVRWMMCLIVFADIWRRFDLRRPRRMCPPRELRHRPQLQRQSARMQARAQELSCLVQVTGAEDGGEILESALVAETVPAADAGADELQRIPQTVLRCYCRAGRLLLDLSFMILLDLICWRTLRRKEQAGGRTLDGARTDLQIPRLSLEERMPRRPQNRGHMLGRIVRRALQATTAEHAERSRQRKMSGPMRRLREAKRRLRQGTIPLEALLKVLTAPLTSGCLRTSPTSLASLAYPAERDWALGHRLGIETDPEQQRSPWPQKQGTFLVLDGCPRQRVGKARSSPCLARQVLFFISRTGSTLSSLLESREPDDSTPPLMQVTNTSLQSTSSTTRASCLGPKSQACGRASKGVRCRLHVGLFFWMLVFLLLPIQCMATGDVRVSVPPTGILGAVSSDAAKTRGTSRMSFSAATLPTARKRSYRRAVHRALKNGSTTYRGKIFTSNDLEAMRGSPYVYSRTKQVQSPTSKRIRVLSANFDGITAAAYDSLALWLQHAEYDVLLMQETHRGFGPTASEWEAAGWLFVSSPDPGTRFAGVAVALRKSLVKGGVVRSAEIVPGRLLHVRISGVHYGIDILSCYQHVISSRESQNKTAAKREQIWTALGRCLSTLPRRNILILGGDLNCSARPQTHVAGPCAPPPSDYYFDQDDLMALATAHSLSFLNTWSRGSGQSMQTFLNGSSNSQIDYNLTRRSSADSYSKQSRPVPTLDFSPWRLGGRHAPVQATIPRKPGWLVHGTRRPPQMGYDKQDLEDSLYHNDHRARLLYHEVQDGVAKLQEYTAAGLNTLLLQKCIEIFPPQQRPRALRPWQQASVQQSVRAMWRQRTALRQVGHAVRFGLYSIRHVLYAFREYARFQRSYRELRRQGREHRKQILLDKLQHAARASQRKDTRALYQVIRQISPKLIAGKVRIRSTDGQSLTPQEEHSEILIYFQALFGTSSQEVTPPARLDPVILEQEEVEASLAQLGTGKAVPA